MIIHSSECVMNLSDYGIQIPLEYNKSDMVYEGIRDGCMKGVSEKLWCTPPSNTPVSRDDLLRVHTPRFVDSLFSPNVDAELIKTFELINPDGSFNRYDPSQAKKPLANLLNDALCITQAGCECAITALRTGFAFFLGGGMHHAMSDYGNGFCLVNDVVIIARHLQAAGLIKTAWIIDIDAHKGDGTAALTQLMPSISTLSIHMADGWPLNSTEYNSDGTYNPSWTPSDIDIGIKKGEDNVYVAKLAEGLERLDALNSTPDIAIIVDGSDPYEKDELASTADLCLTKEMLLERDLLVYDFLHKKNIPQAYLMAGGYGQYSWEIYVNFLSKVLPGLV